MVEFNPEIIQAWSQRNHKVDWPAGLRIATGVNQDPNGIARTVWGKELGASMDEALSAIGGRALVLPGTNGSYVQTVDDAALDILGDIDIRIEFVGVPGVTGLNRDLVSKYTPTAQQSFEWRYNAFGADEFVWSTTGANALTDTATRSESEAVRFHLDADDGGGNRVLTWYDSSDGTLGGTWVQRQQEVVAGATSIFASTAVMRIGARGDASGTNPFLGKIRRMELRNSAGIVVANPDFRTRPPGATGFNDAAGRAWTFHGAAVIA